jgi:CspA family cold shock protein
VPSGVVKWYNESSGYGFIVPDEGALELFVHRGNIRDGARGALSEGERVEFTSREGGMGPEAIDVLPLAASEERDHRLLRAVEPADSDAGGAEGIPRR